MHACCMIWRLLSLGFVAMTAGLAQNVGEVVKPKPPPRSLRLLPLGETPPFRQEVRDGVRFELEPAPGSIPPRQVRLGTGEAAVVIRLNLGRASESAKLAPGTAPVILRDAKAGDDPAVKPWLTLQAPETGDVLGVIWRDPGTPWSKPNTLVFPDSAATFPSGSIRIVNLLPVEAALILGAENLLLKPGNSLVKTVAIGIDHPVQIAYKNKSGQFQRFHSGSVLLNRNERAQLFIHRADGDKPRQPAKAVIFNEAAPARKD